jgi:3-oxoacyl-[acyl-carrier-protein] synthase III
MKFTIKAIEKHLPGQSILSTTLDEQCDGLQGRIEKNTGVHHRYHAAQSETIASMAVSALEKTLNAAGLQPKDLDLLISCGASYDYPVPHNSVVIKSKLTDDSVNFNCIDVDSTCLSFLSAMDIAHLYLGSGRAKRIALVCSEIASCALTPSNEKVFGLFGDAAVAMIIERSESDDEKNSYHVEHTLFENYPSGAMHANVPLGGRVNRGQHAKADDEGYHFNMDGKNLIRLTQKHLDQFVQKMESHTGRKISEYDYHVTHQTSRYGNEYFQRNFNINPLTIIETLHMHGNCIAASIPLGLEKLINQEKNTKNMSVSILGTGAGLTLGSMSIRF